jgi:hypothetical protein
VFRVAALLLCCALAALAQSPGLPIIAKADPQMVYPGSPGWLDEYGRVVITLTGANLGPPDGDMGHPAGPEGGYQHLYVRSVSAGNVATPWVPAVWDNGARVLGACTSSVILLAVDPSRFLGTPGSHLQVKLWVSAGADAATDPSGATQMASPWSAIKTIDAAPAGAVKPVPPPPPPSAPPALTRLVPNDIQLLGAQTSYRLRIYGTHLNPDAGSLKVVFNGDRAGAVPAEDRVHYYDDDGSFTQGGEGLIHVTIPERLRRSGPGQLRIAVMDVNGVITQEKVLTFSAPAVHATGRPAIPGVSPAGVRTPQANPAGAVIPGILGPGPQIARVNPTELKLGDRAAAFRIRIYARQLGNEVPRVVFNGDEASAVPAEDAGRMVDDDGARLPEGERVFHVTIPERHRRATPGVLALQLMTGKARSNTAQIQFTGGTAAPLVRPPVVAPRPPAPAPVAPPAIRR